MLAITGLLPTDHSRLHGSNSLLDPRVILQWFVAHGLLHSICAVAFRLHVAIGSATICQEQW